ncbi:phosphonate ABC transporter, permease protein PhnE [Salipaludibacillus aurantiacus]|uniref:Phosphonate transport system permease protein n=1 Tax=Salipaludibacillus aurantiacus TaxID=1601833 RepID=A0A1H9W9Q0_9BACI|nr:phosphonate ABC transporter, permease protein PhnE [Salipaludibacillus aurantiacus]SES30575.1 phosphonate transport system permease protein [Salipaludibacillus aurantiacus]
MPNLEKNHDSAPTRYPLTPKGFKWYIGSVLLAVLGLYVLSAYQTQAFPDRVIEGLPIMFYFVVEDLWPPNWGYLPRVAMSLLETWNMALFSTTLAAVAALPLSFLAASNINKNPLFYQAIRNAFNLLRTIPEIILAVVFVALVSIGAVSGILALTVFSLGILAKLISETIEAIDPGPLEAVRASGGNVFQVITYGVMPQILPQFASYTLYVLEINVKASVVLGFVGAGGIGIILRQQLNMFNYDNVATIIFMTFLTITIIDLVSNRVRERLE